MRRRELAEREAFEVGPFRLARDLERLSRVPLDALQITLPPSDGREQRQRLGARVAGRPLEKAERLDQVLATLAHGVGTLAVLYSPVMPQATAKLWAALGEAGDLLDQRVDRAWDRPGGGTVGSLEPLFPRIELETSPGAA